MDKMLKITAAAFFLKGQPSQNFYKSHKERRQRENSLGKFHTPNTLQKRKLKIKEKRENGA